jgi:hypothetical protein
LDPGTSLVRCGDQGGLEQADTVSMRKRCSHG